MQKTRDLENRNKSERDVQTLVTEQQVLVRGQPVNVTELIVNGETYHVRGRFVKVARISEEWFRDVRNPEDVVATLTRSNISADVFTFIQRLPGTQPEYGFRMEWEKVTALPIKSLSHWWEHQINADTRKKARRAEKRGIIISVVEFSDELVHGILGIFNEVPMRQGKPFWHYGKDFETVKKEMSADLDTCLFIAAYYEKELVGFVKLYLAGKIAQPVIILSKIAYRQKYVNNALIAETVQISHQNSVEFITYGPWRVGSQAVWLRRNGFQRLMVPRYYIWLSLKGRIVLGLGLQRGIQERLPEKVREAYRVARKKVFTYKGGKK